MTVEHPGYWPTTVETEVRDVAGSVLVLPRRRARLDVSVTRDGVSAAGVAIELACAESGTSVQTWAAAGLLSMAPGPLVTDGEGRILVSSLPEGKYRWGARVAGDLEAEGEVVVDRSDTTLEIRL